jgi:hypothetical protein
MTRTICTCLLAAGVMVGLTLAGCSPAPAPKPVATNHDHDHGAEPEHAHAHPETYAEAVKQIEDLNTVIKEGFAANDLKKADGPVHEVGHILEEDVAKLLEKTQLADDAKAEVKKAAEELFDAFMKLDEKIHDGKGSTYDEVSEKIDAGLATLRKHAPAEAAPPEAKQP